MHVVEINTGVSGYPALLSHVLRNGESREARGMKTIDAGPTTIYMHDVTAALPRGTGRGVSFAIAAAEALQLIGGFSDPVLLPKSFDRFREDDGTFHGAYGTRIGGQLSAAIEKLRRDPGSRQGVITLWDPRLDNGDPRRDIPCTVALTLWLEADRLNLLTLMRSQDCWLGAPYDWFQFVQLLWTAATLLEVIPGIYRHTTVSTHLYDRNVEAAELLVERWYSNNSPADTPREWQPRGLGYVGLSPTQIAFRAHDLRFNRLPEHPTESEKWYAKHLTRHT